MAYAVVLLTTIYCFGFVDRQIFTLVVGPIRRDFGVNDLQIGYLLGPAFIASYISLGLVAGWCVDRFDRRNLLLIAGIGWSLGTIGAGFARSYSDLLVSRFVVGAAEAFLFPGGLSLIADMVDRRRLPVAVSAFLAASPLGSGLALLGGGLILDVTERHARLAIPGFGTIFGWQATLLIVGLIGLAPLLLLPTLRDPRGSARTTGGDDGAAPAFGFVAGGAYMLRRWRFYAMFFLGMASTSMVTLTVGAWTPTFLSRAFGMSPGAIGTRYGILALICGTGACVAGPLVSAWIGRRMAHPTMEAVRLSPYVVLPLALTLGFVRSEAGVLAVLSLLLFVSTLPTTMASASLQIAAPPRLRGLAAACYFVSVGLLGYGIGPTLVPLVAGRILHEPDHIGNAIAIVTTGFAGLSILCLHIAAKEFREEQSTR